MDATTAHAWIDRIARAVRDQKDYLTQLDTAIGDADHGVNLVRGFDAALAALAEKDPETPGAVLTLVGRTLISKVGGASGPLYGTAFRRAGKAMGDDVEVGAGVLGDALQAALDGIQELGAASEGDKTIVDALAPAVRAYRQSVTDGGSAQQAARSAADAAAAGARDTVPIQAHKGRASYLGARSVGHQDPGATSTSYLLEALAGAVGSEP